MIEMSEVKEKAEKLAFNLKEKGRTVVLGKDTLTAGELICTLIGVGIIVYAMWKLQGNNKKYAIAGALAVMVIGEAIW